MITPYAFSAFHGFYLTKEGGLLADYANSAINDKTVAYYYTDNKTPGQYDQTMTFSTNPEGPTLYFPLPGHPGLYLDVGNAYDGGGGHDYVTGYTMADWLVGGTGFDVLKGMGGDDILQGEADADRVYGGDGDDYVYGGEGNDSVYGDAGDDYVMGGWGDDWINGGTGADTLLGGDGNDLYRVDSKSNDVIDETENSGIDTVYLSRTSYTLAANVENIILDANIISGTSLTGNVLANSIIGAQGNDFMYGGAGNDTLTGLTGNDVLYGGTENDGLYGGDGSDKLYGGAGDDTLDGSLGADTMDGGAGSDTYVLDHAGDVIIETSAVGNDLVQSWLTSTTLGANVENLTLLGAGTSDGYGNALMNEITGSVWNNYLDGGDGTDWLWGNLGNDTVRGGLGNDLVSGEFGNDVVYGDDGDDAVEGGEGADWLYGGNGTDFLRGGSGDDFLYGGTGLGLDTVMGEAGNDRIFGGSGNSKVWGGEGNDQICGEGGADTLYGDTGADQFIFASAAESTTSSFDRIMDFVRGVDKIDLSLIDANSTVAGNQAFTWTGAQPFFASPADLYFRSTLIGSVVEGDLNGDKIADFRVVVTGVYDMTAADFIL